MEGKAFYIALGAKEDYSREIIGIYNNPTESAAGWEKVLRHIRRRGLQKIDLVVADGIIGLEEKVLMHYPTFTFQTCVTPFKTEYNQSSASTKETHGSRLRPSC